MFKQGQNRDWHYKESFIVYQFLQVDADLAAKILAQFSDKEKKSGFKKLALVLHPDKNQHPLSKDAFQKASSIFNQ
jgi:DnaJ-class molecular chaperone